MHLGYVSLSGRGRTDACLAAAAAQLAAKGVALAGCVQSAPADCDAHPCDMDLRVLPAGPICASARRLAPRRAAAGWTAPWWNRPRC